jgi:dihydroneopterin aldolase
LPVACIIGIHAAERGSRQQLLISVELATDFTRAAASDKLADTLDYTAIAARIEHCAGSGRFKLIETLAEQLADELLTESVSRIQIDIEKPAALATTRQVGIRIVRTRAGAT